MKKYAPTIVGLFAIFLIGTIVGSDHNKGSSFNTTQLAMNVEALQNTLPRKIDSFSTVTGASFENDILTYEVFLGININVVDIDRIQSTQFIANLFAVCLNPVIVNGLRNGIHINYKYSLASSRLQFTNTILKKDCDPILNGDTSALGDYYIDLQNKTVPNPVDAETTIIKYSRADMTIEIDYQLINWRIEELDIPYFVDYMEREVIPTFCDTPDFRVLSEEGFRYRINYFDAGNLPIKNFFVTKEKC